MRWARGGGTRTVREEVTRAFSPRETLIVRAPEFWFRGGIVPALLSPLGWGYDAAGRARRFIADARRVSVPVVCVGNIVAGGAGKTPVAIALGQRLTAKGRRVHFLCRGYGGKARGPLAVDRRRHDHRMVGDEALLLAERGPTWIARDRAAGADAAANAGADVIVLDDGLQNPSLIKDLSLVVVDGGTGFGNGLVIPAGPLRERISPGLDRAQAMILLGKDTHGAAQLALKAGLPVIRGRLSPTTDSSGLRGQAVLPFAGIGHPCKFFTMLNDMGCRVVARHGFPDHYRYHPDEIMKMVDEAQAKKALLVTTEKDFVRLPLEAQPLVHAVRIQVAWQDTSQIDGLLGQLFAAD